MEEPLLQSSLSNHFDKKFKEHSDRTAVVDGGGKRRLSYRELATWSDSIAAGLQKRGISKGDRVASSLGNSLEHAVLVFACFKAGAIIAPLNPSFTREQLRGALNHVGAKCLVISIERHSPFKTPVSNVPTLDWLIDDTSATMLQCSKVPSIEHIIVVQNSPAPEDLSSKPALTTFRSLAELRTPPVAVDVKPSETAMIQFTSGTTSAPKAACLAHSNLLNNAILIGERLAYFVDDVVCCPPPLFHCFGLIGGLLTVACRGASIVFPAETFDPMLTVQTLHKLEATSIYGVPTMFSAMLSAVSKSGASNFHFARLRTGAIAGSQVHQALLAKILEVFHLPHVTIAFGMTELSAAASMTLPSDSMTRRTTTVGSPLPHTRSRVVKAANPSQLVGPHERGELLISGHQVMTGYWNDEAKTAEALIQDEEGTVWMRTGDEAVIDSNGYITITGRVKDIIIRGGENIYPAEIESVILEHPLVAEASVVGIPDEHYGEIVAAFVVAVEGVEPEREFETFRSSQDRPNRLSPEDIRSWVAKQLPHNLVPKEVFWLADFPKTLSGKIQKFELRKRGQSLLQCRSIERQMRKDTERSPLSTWAWVEKGAAVARLD